MTKPHPRVWLFYTNTKLRIMKNNNTTIGSGRFDKYKTPWRNKSGVFETPMGKWIVRVVKGKDSTPSTISQHNSKEEALSKFKCLNKAIQNGQLICEECNKAKRHLTFRVCKPCLIKGSGL
jgi:hypothetical protein